MTTWSFWVGLGGFASSSDEGSDPTYHPPSWPSISYPASKVITPVISSNMSYEPPNVPILQNHLVRNSLNTGSFARGSRYPTFEYEGFGQS